MLESVRRETEIVRIAFTTDVDTVERSNHASPMNSQTLVLEATARTTAKVLSELM